MTMVRTLLWIIVSVVFVTLLVMNLQEAPLNFWPLERGYLHFQWPVGLIAIVFFLLGLVPMWLLHLARRWHMKRRITALEASARQPSAALTTTQLDAAAASDTPEH